MTNDGLPTESEWVTLDGVKLPPLQPTLAYAVQDKAARDMIRAYARAAIAQERELTRRVLKRLHITQLFDEHMAAIRGQAEGERG